MAALVVRSSDEKSLLSGLGHSLFQPDKVSRIRNEDADAALSGGRNGRSRKAKNGPKKQPQRGLGVAQLERLRIQEQNKQDAACLASLGLVPLPSNYGFAPEQVLPQHFLPRHVKGGAVQINTASLLSLGTSSNGGGGYRNNSDHHKNGGFQPDGGEFHDPSLSIVLQDSSHGGVFRSSGALKNISSVNLVSSADYKMSSSASMRAYRNSEAAAEVMKQEMKLHKTLGEGGGGHRFGVNSCVQLFDASLPPGGPLQRDPTRELSLVGVPKELSSFQTKLPGNHVWQTLHNQAKRPCVMLQQNPRVLISLDPGEISIHSSSPQSESAADNNIFVNKGAHYTPRSISNALGKSSSSSPPLPFLRSENTNTSCSSKPNGGGFDSNGMNLQKTDCSTDSMSSVSNMPFVLQQRKRPSPYHDSASPPKKAAIAASSASDFLSLSLSIFHGDVSCDSPGNCKSGDDSSLLQQRSLSLQETVTDVDEGSQRSPSSYDNNSSMDGGIEVDGIANPVPQKNEIGFGGVCFAGKCGGTVDLSLKLAI